MKKLSALLVANDPVTRPPLRRSRSQGWSCMALVLGVLAFAAPAAAQMNGLGWQCVAGDPSKACPVSASYPLPVSTGIAALTPVAGTQENLAIASATSMTIPSGATVALVQAQGTNNASGNCMFVQDDGTDPTGTTGIAIPAYERMMVRAASGFRMIAATGATCTVTIAYYK